MQLQYLGFEHTNGTRTRNYIFQEASPGQESRRFTVAAEIALFVQHRVGIQEGPVLSLRKLMMELQSLESSRRPAKPIVLTEQDLLEFMNARALGAAKKSQAGRRHTSANGRPGVPRVAFTGA
jgi:hypothetical protein